jgi:hypothetical protein
MTRTLDPNLPVACDSLDCAIVAAEGDVESNDSVAGLDEVQVLLGNISLRSSAVEEKLDLLEETGLLERVELGTEVLGVQS